MANTLVVLFEDGSEEIRVPNIEYVKQDGGVLVAYGGDGQVKKRFSNVKTHALEKQTAAEMTW